LNTRTLGCSVGMLYGSTLNEVDVWLFIILRYLTTAMRGLALIPNYARTFLSLVAASSPLDIGNLFVVSLRLSRAQEASSSLEMSDLLHVVAVLHL
jgi:hypothetical protein